MIIPIIILAIFAFIYTQYEKNKRNEFIAQNKANPIKNEQKKLIDKIKFIGNTEVTKERDNELEINVNYNLNTKGVFNISRTKEKMVYIKLNWEKNGEIGTELWKYPKNEVDENIVKVIDFINETLL